MADQFTNESNEGVAFQGDANEQSGEVESVRDKFVTLENISELAYESHRAWEKILGEPPTLPWDELAPEKQREWMDSVTHILNHPHAPVASQHDYWRSRKLSGPHAVPISGNCGKSFDELTFDQSRKAIICRFIVHAIVG